MLSGTGRHRRPRQAPAVFVTAGVTGAGFALPLLAASGAQAADTATWDQVSECESGGVWSANAENGYYGGLQLTLSTWEKYGGTAYAERPDLASRNQQIAIAEQILQSEGPEAWPACAGNGGLYEDLGAVPDVDPGDLPLPSGSGDSGDEDAGSGDGVQGGGKSGSGGTSEQESPSVDPSGSSSGKPSENADEESGDGKSPQASTSPDPTGSASAQGESADEDGTGTGKHRGSPDPGEQVQERDETDRGSGRDADREELAPEDYEVEQGDSLSGIAEDHEMDGWTGLYEGNQAVVGSDPDLIHPGLRLEVGLEAAGQQTD